MNTNEFNVIGLDGQNVAFFKTREYANLCAAEWNKQTDTAKQDKDDAEFCAKYGVPFQPRRYFVAEVTQ
jgi:hypothetical protein